MDCPNCGRANRAGANFCRFCGTHFAAACPMCRTVLLEDSAFCDNCGFQLSQSPPTVALPRPAGHARPVTPRPAAAMPAHTPASTPAHKAPHFIPAEMLRKLEAARATGEMVGERRVVTMLFCDVKGSTAAAEQLDPEDFTEIMNGAFEHMINPVYKYEGTLARLMGDAILAFFGAPIAHEDDPQRAVLAGLDIVAAIEPFREKVRRKWGIDFNVRVGINTGLVVVGAVGSDLRLEYSALGDAINLAARMEQTAQPGTVQIAQDTYRSVRTQFDFEELGQIEVKGKSQPVLAYRVLGRKAVTGRARGIEGLHADIVGRAEELRALRDVVGDLKQGVGRIVLVLGEAGLGKSRLVGEAAKIFHELLGPDAGWYDTISLSYETNQAYGLLQRLVRRMHGIDHNAASGPLRQQLAELVDSLPEARRRRAGQVFEALFGLENDNGALPLDVDNFKRELRDAMEAWWRVRFEGTPTLLAFDDLHWSDSASIELLRQLMPLVNDLPLVIVGIMRVERQAPAWQIKVLADDEYTHRYSELMLKPLSEADSNELLNRLLANPDLPARLRASILEKSSGNPFFIEEVVRTLIGNGAVTAAEREVDGQKQRYWRAASDTADFEIPDNLQSLLAARMDRLEDGTRATLQMASVIGRSFYRRLLQAVVDGGGHLDQQVAMLLRLDMIREAARMPEIEYAFRNSLTQEAVYKTILLKRRRDFHGRVGAAMEALYPDQLDTLYGLLAHHFTLAGQSEKAITYARQAARRAVGLYAYGDALQNLKSALALVPAGETSETHLLLREELGDVSRLMRDGAGAIRHYQEALAVCQLMALSDPMISVRVNRKIVQVVAELKWSVGLADLQQAMAAGRAARASLEANLPTLIAGPPQPETVRVLIALSTDAWRIQEPPDWESAQRFAEAAVSLAEPLGGWVDQSQALGALATVLDGRGRLREHLRVAEQRLDICRGTQSDDVRERLEALRGLGSARMYVGEYHQALLSLQEAEALAVQTQTVDQQVSALMLQMQCCFRLDRWDDVLSIETKWRGLEQRYARERVGETCFAVALSASVHALRGNLAMADSYAEESYKYMFFVSGGPDHWQRNQFY